MNNATYFFDELAVIIKAGNRHGSVLSDVHVEALCLHFREVFVLWDGAFSLARTVNPTEHDTTTYLQYVQAGVHGNAALRCTIAPKVHLMLKHVACQMWNIWGGVRRQNGGLGGTPPSDRNASATALPHCPEPGHPHSCAGEGKFPFVASQCDCSHQGNKRREQAFLFCRENR